MEPPASPRENDPRSPRHIPLVEGLRYGRDSVYGAMKVGLWLMTVDAYQNADRNDDEIATNTRIARTTVRYSSADSLWSDWSFATPSIMSPSSLNKEKPSDNAGTGNDPFHDSHTIEEVTTSKNSLQRLNARRSEIEVYHVFSKQQRWLVVIIIGVAGLFSGLSSNIYFPALNAIATELNVSLNEVSLTITSYLIIQGISPVIWGSFSDVLGRRPIYIASFAVYIIANIALSFSPNFAVLLIFRGIQAAGSASTVSIGNGVIQDITPPAERGAFISFYQAIRNFSIAIGPVLGGLLAKFFGFRSIFVFLLILSSMVIVVIIIFLPETMRSIAGNGSLRLGGIYKPLVQHLVKEPAYKQDPDENVVRQKVTVATFIEPLKLLAEKDILLHLVFGGVVYTIWSMVTASTSGLFKNVFGLDEILIGLAFLPNGFGTIVGSAIVGTLMTRDYKAAEEAYKTSHGLPPEQKLSPKKVPIDFPIEHARLRHLPWISGLFIVSTAAYGFSLAFPAVTTLPGWIAVPLLFQFLIAGTSNAVFALNTTLVSDLCPGKGASATAINNLVRCGLAAVGVAFNERLVAAVGPAPAFLGLALITVAFVPMVVVNWYWGTQWREDRVKRIEAVDK